MDNDSKKDTSVSISVIQFVDRAVESERRLTSSELARINDRAAQIEQRTERDLAESKRRLDGLNHAHAQRERDMLKYVQLEVFNQYIEGMSKWREEVNNDRANIAGGKSSNVALIAVTLAILQVLAVVVVKFWH